MERNHKFAQYFWPPFDYYREVECLCGVVTGAPPKQTVVWDSILHLAGIENREGTNWCETASIAKPMVQCRANAKEKSIKKSTSVRFAQVFATLWHWLFKEKNKTGNGGRSTAKW